MSQLLSLGALNKLTCEYVYPKIANKKDEYICPECNKDLILCQGKIRVHHFRHKVDSVNPCHYYNNPSETQIHKDAKMLMKTLLENKTPIEFIRGCVSCKKNEIFKIPEIKETSMTDSIIIDGSIIELEYKFEYNGFKIADVAYIDNGEILYIFEICNTHRTCSKNRPEPWFEIDAKTLIQKASDNSLSSLQLHCIRCEKCKDCIKIDDKRILTSEINIDKFIYLNIEFSKKDMIKELGGKWNKEHKLWYISNSIFKKKEKYINEFIGDKIIWIGYNGRSQCETCNGSGTSYYSDDYYGSCLGCCCINCSKFNYECQCKYCEACESSYLEGETHICYLCEKCGKYTEELREHCKMCCICNKYNRDIRTNGKCDVCYYIK